jgi:hypothetical protein
MPRKAGMSLKTNGEEISKIDQATTLLKIRYLYAAGQYVGEKERSYRESQLKYHA